MVVLNAGLGTIYELFPVLVSYQLLERGVNVNNVKNYRTHLIIILLDDDSDDEEGPNKLIYKSLLAMVRRESVEKAIVDRVICVKLDDFPDLIKQIIKGDECC